MQHKNKLLVPALLLFLSGCSILNPQKPQPDTKGPQVSPPDATLEEHRGNTPLGELFPVYPSNTTSGERVINVCLSDMQEKSQNALASLINTVISQNLLPQSSAIYCAPSIINAKYSDCLSSVTWPTSEIFSNFGFALVQNQDDEEFGVSQNINSHTFIPNLMRMCRSKHIPYIALNTIDNLNNHAVMRLRIIEVSSGANIFDKHINI